MSKMIVECKKCHHRQPYMPLLPGCAVCGALLTDPSAPKKKKVRRKKKPKGKPAKPKKEARLEDIVMKCSYCGKTKMFFDEDPQGAWIRSLSTPLLQTICASCLAEGKTLTWPEV